MAGLVERTLMRTVIVWWDLSESAEAAAQPLPSRAAALIGYPPTQSEVFDVEATVEGRYEVAQLAFRGLAFSAAPGTYDHREAAAPLDSAI